MNIVLLEPEIPSNTGNIGRTCVLTNSKLHLIKPLGFSLDDKYLKRAGLDYWSMLSCEIYENLEEFFQINRGNKFYFATTKAENNYADFSYTENDFIIFGKESKGIPEDILNKNKETCIRIPMLPMGRSLNLSNSVSIILYEALRQNNFDFMKGKK